MDVWNLLSKEQIGKIEGIQGKSTKMVIELRTMGYQERLRSLRLTTLEIRRKGRSYTNIQNSEWNRGCGDWHGHKNGSKS